MYMEANPLLRENVIEKGKLYHRSENWVFSLLLLWACVNHVGPLSLVFTTYELGRTVVCEYLTAAPVCQARHLSVWKVTTLSWHVEHSHVHGHSFFRKTVGSCRILKLSIQVLLLYAKLMLGIKNTTFVNFYHNVWNKIWFSEIMKTNSQEVPF